MKILFLIYIIINVIYAEWTISVFADRSSPNISIWRYFKDKKINAILPIILEIVITVICLPGIIVSFIILCSAYICVSIFNIFEYIYRKVNK